MSKIENTVPWIYIINDLNGEGIIGTFNKEKQLQKASQKEFNMMLFVEVLFFQEFS